MIYIILPTVFIILAALYLYAIKPGRDNSIEPLLGWHYAHRGLHSLKAGIPENTMPAFEKAAEGSYGIELDIRLSRDGQVIVFHDDNLERACGTEIMISDLSYEEIKKYELFNTKQHIPLLSEVLDMVSGRIPIIIELKTCYCYKDLCEKLVNILKGYNGIYCVESFDPRIVRWFNLYQPGVIRGQLSACLFKEKGKRSLFTNCAISYLLTNFMSRPDFIAHKHEDKENLSFILCRKILKANTVAWTVRSSGEMENLSDEFDLFIFEGFTP